MLIAITTYATRSYAYALGAQIPLTVAALRYANLPKGSAIVFILAGDASEEVRRAALEYGTAIQRLGGEFVQLVLPVQDNGNRSHEEASNLQIASMQQAAWNEARLRGVDLCWSLESDILPQPKTLRCMMDALAFDRGWYDIAMATYPNQGFLGGRATPQRHILPNVYPDERALTPELEGQIKAREEREKALRLEGKPPSQEELEGWRQLDRALEQCPAKGNVMELNAKQWRPRGWLDYAYPAIGRGAILPTDWVGVGCTLLSSRALELADFTGYDGKGTQDLWLCWRCWHPAALKMAVVTHALCSHVKRRPDTGEFFIMHARHELGGPYDGHLRTVTMPWGASLTEQVQGRPSDASGTEDTGHAAELDEDPAGKPRRKKKL